jgi:uncharacterized protein YbjT (DUF2867 family)
MRVAVAGGTGAVGRRVVDVLAGRGHDPVVLARSRGTDVTTGAGLADALAGAAALVDVVSVSTLDGRTSERFFRASTTHLLSAAAAAGVPHVVALSIVGIDASPGGYYAGKVVQEQLVQAGPVPWTILRATQFHEFAAQVAVRGRVGPVVGVPQMRTQPVAAREVAERLADLVEAGPAGRVPDLGGPRVERLSDLVRAYLRATGSRVPVLPLALPGRTWSGRRGGVLLPGPGAALGRQPFDAWLAAEVSGSSGRAS